MANNPTDTIHVKEATDIPEKPSWRRIGAIFPNKSGNGGRVVWDEGTTTIPVEGELFIFPFKEKEPGSSYEEPDQAA